MTLNIATVVIGDLYLLFDHHKVKRIVSALDTPEADGKAAVDA